MFDWTPVRSSVHDVRRREWVEACLLSFHTTPSKGRRIDGSRDVCALQWRHLKVERLLCLSFEGRSCIVGRRIKWKTSLNSLGCFIVVVFSCCNINRFPARSKPSSFVCTCCSTMTLAQTSKWAFTPRHAAKTWHLNAKLTQITSFLHAQMTLVAQSHHSVFTPKISSECLT